MLRPDDHSALNRIVMHVIQFLDHHFIIQNRLGMKSFLPDLVFAPRFVPCAIIAELIEQAETIVDVMKWARHGSLTIYRLRMDGDYNGCETKFQEQLRSKTLVLERGQKYFASSFRN